MSKMESNVRELLSDLASEAGSLSSLPRAVGRRVRLRRIVASSALFLGALGIAFGILFGISQTVNEHPQKPASPHHADSLDLPGKPKTVASSVQALWIATSRTIDGREHGKVTRIALGSGRISTYDVGHIVGGMEMAAGQEGVFVVQNANTGTVVQLDPHSGKVLGRFLVPGHGSLVVGAGSLWAGDCNGSLVRFDPASHRQIARIPAIAGPGPPSFKCLNPLLFADHAVWILAAQHRLSELDPKTLTESKAIPLPFAYTEGSTESFVATRNRIWASFSNELDGRARIVGASAKTGHIIASRYQLPEAHGQIRALAADDRYVWLAVPGKVLWLDTSDLRIVRVSKVADPIGLSLARGTLWIVEGGPGRLRHIPTR